MAGISVGGLVSGLDTASIISQLMQIESLPQNALKNRIDLTGQRVSAYQSVNTRLASALAAAEKLVKDPAWGPTGATSSAASVVATSTVGAATGTITFSVDRVARAHSLASPAVPQTAAVVESGRTSLTVNQGGTTTEVALVGEDAVSVARAINGAGAGVRANAIAVGGGAYRLQVTSLRPGEEGTFTVDGLTVDDTVTATGQDALIRVGGTLPVQSADGRFIDVLPGTSFTVSSVATDVQVTVRRDDAAVTASVKAMVDTVNTALQEIGSRTRTVAGGKAAVLSGDSLLRGLTQQLLSSTTASGTSPAEAGIQVSRGGELTFDAEAFGRLVATDPARAQDLVRGVADRLVTITRDASSSTGSVTTAATRLQDTVRGLGDQVAAWDTRLALRRSNLERQYSALETALGSLQTQSSWLSGQLAGLPSWSAR